MHPSPAALLTMSDEDLNRYRKELSDTWNDADDNTTFNPLYTRIKLIDAIQEDRKRAKGSALDKPAEPPLLDCPNCYQPDHGPIKGACLLGVLLTVFEATLARPLTPTEREQISTRFDDDHFYDSYIPPITDYLKTLIAP